MNIYFSDIKSVLLAELQKSTKEILVAVSWLTDKEIFALLLNKLQAGVKVSIITRNDFLNNHAAALLWKKFIDAGGDLRFCQPGKMLHYKFAVMDGKNAIATSYNWTCFAGNNNRENIMVFDEVKTISDFTKEFEFLCTQFPLESNPARIELQNINSKLHGFYELTIADDEKNQKIVTTK